MTEKNDLAFIEHILDSIKAIKEFSRGIRKVELISSRLKQSAIVREIEIIGEAVKNLSEQLKSKYKGIEWREIAGTRDKMIHHYFGVDLNIVWNIIKKDLPVLRKKIKEIKEELTRQGRGKPI
ncbi:MAG: DUF86 domain-containing protein [Nanoarchaeota archaeon]